MVIHTTEIDENNLFTLSTYGKYYLLVVIHDGEIDSLKLPTLKEAMTEYRLAVTQVRKR